MGELGLQEFASDRLLRLRYDPFYIDQVHVLPTVDEAGAVEGISSAEGPV